jgi:Lipopolysaccharide kinase (Kdo/WaaP) family.
MLILQNNNEYKHLEDFLMNLPNIFAQTGTVIYEGRNEIRLIPFGDELLAVKSFKIPHIINKIAYGFLRPSKAKRSYEYALQLKKKGVNTPTPIAYIEEKKCGLLLRSYYISSYENYSGLLRELAFHPLEEVKDLVEAFAHFTASLHNQQILHLDYSPGNIMYEKIEEQYKFCLVDINRMKFVEVDMKTGCFNLCRLWGSNETISHIARIYAKDRNFDEQKCVELVLHYHKKFWEGNAKRNPKIRPYMA